MNKLNFFGIGSCCIFLAVLFSFILLTANAQAATYMSIKPGKEMCTTIIFGEHGRGEYTLTAFEPASGGWIDNHFTSFIAGPENIIFVPICFSAVGRRTSENANIRVVVSTPTSGNVTYDYGICVANYEDVDVIEGKAASGNACDAMAGHTDIFTASLAQPEMYANPGESVSYTLMLDSSLPLELSISRGAEEMRILASKTSVEAGGGQQSVTIQLTAPNTPGDYAFSVVISVQGCSIADCRREVKGILHVKAQQQRPQAGFYVWLTPQVSSTIGQTDKEYNVQVQNYDEGQEVTVTVNLDDGLESNFAPYTTFLEKGDSKRITFTVKPATAERRTYKIEATATGVGGVSMKSDPAWLTVDEMVADADKLGKAAFIAAYDETGGAGLTELEELKSGTEPVTPGNNGTPGNDGTSPPAGTNVLLYIVIGVVAAVALILVFIIYKRTTSGEEGLTWDRLGI